ncbi:3,9-dihydroxypterocarpan 6A-monooxygenase-like [Aristolochia californica]|uniref:3,9-dihydroxypterocarpan 6A-monooxygenase-like n=1 Tax=Aristolochia californica TaxID=171875 RepID=UPI0035D7EC79
MLIIWLIATLFMYSFLKRYRNPPSVPLRQPPSPLALPIVGHLYLFGPLHHVSFRNLSRRFGPLVRLRLGSLGYLVSVCSPALAKEFFKTHDITFASRPRLAGLEYIGEGDSRFAFASYGPYWKFMKKLCVNELFSGKKLDRMARIRREEIHWLLGSLSEKAGAQEPADMEALLTALTNNIICRMAMSTRCSGNMNDAEVCKKVVQELIEIAAKLNLVNVLGFIGSMDILGYGRRLTDVHGKFMIMVERIMKEHEEKQRKRKEQSGGGVEVEEEDLMDILLGVSRDENTEIRLRRDDVKVFLQDLFIAGTETASVAMQWAVAELINQPRAFKKMRDEIEEAVGKTRVVEESDIPNLPYVQATLMETLRLHPAVPLILRESSRDCTIAGFDIPAKTKACINIWAINRDPDHWENPDEFRPERFLNSDGTIGNSGDMKGQNFHFLPFGGGRRMCPGASLALRVMHVAVAAMVQCFDYKLAGGATKVDMREQGGFTLRMAHPLHCVPLQRINQSFYLCTRKED